MEHSTARLACALLGATLAIGCGGSSGGGDGGGPFGLGGRVPVTSLTFPLTAPAAFDTEAYDGFPGVRFSSPVFVTAAPNDASRLFVVEQGGLIRVFPMSPSATQSQVTTFLDLTGKVVSGDEMGLLGLAFDPDYATNRRFYVNYTAPSPLHSVVSRFQVSASNPNVADPTETILFTVAQPFENHNGGMLAFGPDRLLYCSFGDGGSGGDPNGNAQKKTTLLGKILRIDPNSTSPYGIPADNPFATSTGGERKEIWAWGLRNPWRFSFDRGTGDLWLGDVGQNAHEEIDLVRKGGNYGWNRWEGTAAYDPNVQTGPVEAPVIDYDRGLGSCVIGGYVYRGAAVPNLVGHYVYSDLGSGRVWALGWNGSVMTSNVQIASVYDISSYGEDATGELLACEHGGGRLLRFRPVQPGSVPFPQTISATGIFSDLASLTPAAGLVPYDVNLPLWSDGTLKDRAVALPGDERIVWSEDGAWTFPGDTVLVKTFRLPLTAGDPSTAVKVETRVLIGTASGWEGYSYRWRDDQSDADLLPGADSRTFTIADASTPGGTRAQTWSFPSRSDCLRCHTAAAGRVLGLTTRQMNGVYDYAAVGGGVDNQLRTWSHIGMFSQAIPSADSLPAHPALGDATASVATRARAYLESNCSMCHRPGGPTPVSMDLRSTVPVASMGVLGVAPTEGNLGLVSPFLVDSGNRLNSMLWVRMQQLDSHRMPPLGTTVVDASGSAVVGQWIDVGP